jgi:head-tail adaptor
VLSEENAGLPKALYEGAIWTGCESMIGGNLKATIQISTATKNGIGESVKAWTDVQTIKGWLDLGSGDSSYTTYNAKIQESTHVFVADFVKLDSRITAENSRLVINSKHYDVMLIDNPMELNHQLEIYLKFTGGL